MRWKHQRTIVREKIFTARNFCEALPRTCLLLKPVITVSREGRRPEARAQQAGETAAVRADQRLMLASAVDENVATQVDALEHDDKR